MRSHLTDDQLAALERAIRTRLAELRRQFDTHQESRSRVDHARDVLLRDGDDAPQRDADREVDLALTDMDVAEMAALQQALARAQSGHYGLCLDCGAEIPYARLALEPHALRCVGCASARERGSAPHASL